MSTSICHFLWNLTVTTQLVSLKKEDLMSSSRSRVVQFLAYVTQAGVNSTFVESSMHKRRHSCASYHFECDKLMNNSSLLLQWNIWGLCQFLSSPFLSHGVLVMSPHHSLLLWHLIWGEVSIKRGPGEHLSYSCCEDSEDIWV